MIRLITSVPSQIFVACFCLRFWVDHSYFSPPAPAARSVGSPIPCSPLEEVSLTVRFDRCPGAANTPATAPARGRRAMLTIGDAIHRYVSSTSIGSYAVPRVWSVVVGSFWTLRGTLKSGVRPSLSPLFWDRHRYINLLCSRFLRQVACLVASRVQCGGRLRALLREAPVQDRPNTPGFRLGRIEVRVFFPVDPTVSCSLGGAGFCRFLLAAILVPAAPPPPIPPIPVPAYLLPSHDTRRYARHIA